VNTSAEPQHIDPPQTWSDERFQLALELVEKSSRLSRQIQDRFGKESISKSDSSPVTVADLSVQVVVALSLAQAFPEDRLIAEETSEQLTSDGELLVQLQTLIEPHVGRRSRDDILGCFRSLQSGLSGFSWILDPIDGTKGFLRGDQFAIALAGMRDGGLKFGLLGCPRLGVSGVEHGPGVLGVAYLGKGTWQSELGSMEWEPVTVSKCERAQDVRLLRSFEAGHTNEVQIEDFIRSQGIEAPPVRLDSQAKYLLLARGDAEAVVRCLSPKRPDYKEKIWDQAAGAIVVTEAGGYIADLKGEKLDFSTGRTLLHNTGVIAHNTALSKLDWAKLGA
jgi:HAL2 family 3'(2'),5'-bisphosphate nucleotidase